VEHDLDVTLQQKSQFTPSIIVFLASHEKTFPLPDRIRESRPAIALQLSHVTCFKTPEGVILFHPLSPQFLDSFF
jgi:hypothetical protein